jgi:hypothetical protein
MITLEVSRVWRERAIKGFQKLGSDDLGYRPASGMSSFGWLLAHQAALYDYSLNVLVKGGSPKNPELFRKYTLSCLENTLLGRMVNGQEYPYRKLGTTTPQAKKPSWHT